MNSSESQRELARQSFINESAYFRVSSPLFSAITRSCAEDRDLLDLASATRYGQKPGQMLPFVAQYLLLKSPEPSLAQFFPALSEAPGSPQQAFPAFREFCLDRRLEVSELLTWRTANTNLVEKASCLLPALQYVRRLSPEPLTLLEICCSAGLNMLVDEYHYDYGSRGQLGSPKSPVQLQCAVVGSGRPPLDEMPLIADRVGVDLVAVDPTDPKDRLWMEAVLFPEWSAERQRLRAALEIRAQRTLRTIIGDALHVLPSLLDELGGSICILQTYCINHWSAESRAALEELLCRVGRNRDIHRIAMEMPDSEPPATARDRLKKIAAAGLPLLRKSFPSRIEHTWYSNGSSNTSLLAQGDGFGAWLDWQASNH